MVAMEEREGVSWALDRLGVEGVWGSWYCRLVSSSLGSFGVGWLCWGGLEAVDVVVVVEIILVIGGSHGWMALLELVVTVTVVWLCSDRFVHGGIAHGCGGNGGGV
jgi:hypothetical protein